MTKENSNISECEKQTKGGRNKIFVIVIVLFISLSVGGYYFWAELNNAKLALEKLSRETSLNFNTSEKTITNLEDLITKLSVDQESLMNTLASLHQQQPLNNEDLALAEVEYLLVIATHRLILERDVTTALSAMEEANKRLKDLSNPQLTPLREQLKQDIDQLHAVNTVDISSLAIYLADLINRSDSLPLKMNSITSKQSETIREDDDENISWKDFPALAWSELKNLVVIKRNDNSSQPLLLVEEQYFLYQNLRLELENARLAVLLADTDNLQASINSIIKWLNRYFDTNAAAVVNVLETLEHMATVDLGPELPDISSSLESLRAYTRSSEQIDPGVGSVIEESAL
jgi:uroporphyrin-3 C-methyltransferase